MADEQQPAPDQAQNDQGTTQEPESADTPSPMPEGGQTPQPEEKSAGSEEQVKEQQLPEDASERTRREFEKLTKSNKELKSQLEEYENLKKETRKRQYGEDVLSSLRPQGQPGPQTPFQQQVNNQSEAVQERVQEARHAGVTAEQLVDDNGMLDVNKLNQVITRVNQTAAQAANVAQQAEERAYRRVEEKRQVEEAHKEHPEINPQSDNFDRSLYRETRAYLVDSMLNPGDYDGKQLSLPEAARLAKGDAEKVDKKSFEKGAQAAMQNLTPKEQAARSAQTRSDQRQPQADMGEIRYKTRKGDDSTLAARIKNATE